jgi:hypothetical protein
MQRFILTENIARFQRRLADETDEGVRRTVGVLLAGALRELALFDSSEAGAARSGNGKDHAAANAQLVAGFLREVETSAKAYLLLDPGPGLCIVGLNTAFAQVTLSDPDRLIGQRLFDIFPENPALPYADGLRKLYQSLCLAAQTGRPKTVEALRYDLRAADGPYLERRWCVTITPIHAPEGGLAHLLVHAEDITAARSAGAAPDAGNPLQEVPLPVPPASAGSPPPVT